MQRRRGGEIYSEHGKLGIDEKTSVSLVHSVFVKKEYLRNLAALRFKKENHGSKRNLLQGREKILRPCNQ